MGDKTEIVIIPNRIRRFPFLVSECNGTRWPRNTFDFNPKVIFATKYVKIIAYPIVAPILQFTIERRQAISLSSHKKFLCQSASRASRHIIRFFLSFPLSLRIFDPCQYETEFLFYF